MAELGRVFVLQGGTQKNLAALKAQVDYIEKRVPNAEVYLHPHTRRGRRDRRRVRGAARRRAAAARRRSSASIRRSTSSTRRRTTRTTRCNFCPNNCSRTFIDTKTLDGKTAPLHLRASPARRARSRTWTRCKLLNKERKKRMKQFPNLVDYEAKLAFKSFYEPAPMPEHGAPVEDIVVKRTLLGAVRHKADRAPVPARRAPTSWAKRKRRPHRHPARAEPLLDGPVLAHVLRGARPRLAQRRVQRRDRPRRCGRPAASTARSTRATREGRARRTSTTCCSSTTRRSRSTTSSSRHHPHPDVHREPDGHGELPGRRRARRRSSARRSRRRPTSSPSAASATSTRRSRSNEPLMCKQQMFDEWGPLLGITEDESDFADRRGVQGARARSRTRWSARAARSSTRSRRENRVALLMLGRPYHHDPGLNHGIPEEFQVLGYPILSMRSLPRDKATTRRAVRRGHREGRHRERRSTSPTCGRRTTRPTGAEGVGGEVRRAPPERRVPRSLELQVRPRRADLRPDRLDHRVGAARPYSALHDIDANKPSGSIKIRVKTYAHTLMLLKEKLEDQATKKVELDRARRSRRSSS